MKLREARNWDAELQRRERQLAATEDFSLQSWAYDESVVFSQLEIAQVVGTSKTAQSRQ